MIFSSFNSFADGYSVPSGYNFISGGYGVDLYSSNNSDIYVQVVDLKNGGAISFDGFSSPSYNPDPIDKINKKYFREDIADIYTYYKSNVNNLFSVVNGQFFSTDYEYTKLAFPVKSNGSIKANEDNEKSLKKRVIVIDYKKNAYIFDYKKDILTNNFYKEELVGFNPVVNKSASASIGRNYIGIISNRYVLFFNAKNKTQNSMLKVTSSWNVKSTSLVMMDGSGSSQMIARDNYSIYGSSVPYFDFPDYRKIPHVILILDKQNLLASY